jgi:hypothetical protein
LIAFGDERVQAHDAAIEERVRDDVPAVRGQHEQHVDRRSRAEVRGHPHARFDERQLVMLERRIVVAVFAVEQREREV